MASSATQGITVVVTGGAGGLGKVIAQTFLKGGSNVAICDIDKNRLSQCEQDWQEYDGKFLLSQTNITDEAAVQEFINNTTTKFGRLDLVINNAGVMDTFDPIGTTTKESWDRVLAINLTGTFLIGKAAVNAMEAQSPPGGTLINIGSVASYKGVNAGLAYTVSKHGVLGLTRSTAGFYGDKGIFSIALLIGGMDDTNISDSFMAGMNEAGMQRLYDVNPGYVVGKTNVPLEDVAKYCVFLADRGIAASSNGGAVTFNKNWPAA